MKSIAKQIISGLIVGLVAVFLVTGCGDSSSATEEPPQDKPIAKAAFLKQANRICKATIDKVVAGILPVLEKEEKKPGSDRAAVEVKLVSTVAVPELRAEVEKIEALGSPPGDEDQVSAILDSIVELIEKAEENPETLVGTNKAFAKPANLAERYGLSTCPYG